MKTNRVCCLSRQTKALFQSLFKSLQNLTKMLSVPSRSTQRFPIQATLSTSVSRTTSSISTFTHIWSFNENFDPLGLKTGLLRCIVSAPFHTPQRPDCHFRLRLNYANKDVKKSRAKYDVTLIYSTKKWFKSTRFGVKAFVLNPDGMKKYLDDSEFNIKVARITKTRRAGSLYFSNKAGDKDAKLAVNAIAFGVELTQVHNVVTRLESIFESEDSEEEEISTANENESLDGVSLADVAAPGSGFITSGDRRESLMTQSVVGDSDCGSAGGHLGIAAFVGQSK